MFCMMLMSRGVLGATPSWLIHGWASAFAALKRAYTDNINCQAGVQQPLHQLKVPLKLFGIVMQVQDCGMHAHNPWKHRSRHFPTVALLPTCDICSHNMVMVSMDDEEDEEASTRQTVQAG
jgi:hypothetical protein